MTDFSETGTIQRRQYNGEIMGIVANAIRPGSTLEELEYKTGLSYDDVKLALNLLHTKSLVVMNGGLWYKSE